METLESKQRVGKITVLTSEVLLEHWLGHRRVTRRVIEAFPEDKLFTYSVGGMRPFAQLVMEMLAMGAPGVRGVVDRHWPSYAESEKSVKASTRKELLQQWDDSTEQIADLWPKISEQRFHENDKFFGQYEGPIYWSLMYQIDNEIHHRGQGYVYLRALGIEPPPFWERN